MIRRPYRVTFRLNEQERIDLTSLHGYEYCWDDSLVLRHALKLLKRKKNDEDIAKVRAAQAASDKSKSPGRKRSGCVGRRK